MENSQLHQEMMFHSTLGPEPDYPVILHSEPDRLQLASGILVAVFYGVGILLFMILLALIYTKKQLVKSNMQKMIAIYILIQFVTTSCVITFHASWRINNSWIFSHAACQFYHFVEGFIWASKCLMVMMIAVFALLERSTTSRGNVNRPEFLFVVVSFAVIGGIAIITASVLSAMAIVIYNSCASSLDDWDIVREVIIDGLLVIIPAFIALVITNVLILKRRNDQAIRPESIIIVTALFFLCVPSALIRLVTSFYHGIPMKVWMIVTIIEHFEMAFTPALLLVTPTAYNTALREKIAKLFSRPREEQRIRNNVTEEKEHDEKTAAV